MKNYSKLSDFEINSLVAHHEFGDYETCEGSIYVDSKAEGENVIPVSGIFDPCNNPSDAWPVIEKNNIALYLETEEDSPDAGYSFTTGYWVAENGDVHGGTEQYKNHNPLRAAMIVFLMMKDGE